MARRLEIWPLDRLVPYARNARTHSPEQVAQIAASIIEFGFNNPILVDTNAGIIAGHGRLLAARKLGLDECPVVVLDHLSETQRRAYIIADNKLALNAGWDSDVNIRENGENGKPEVPNQRRGGNAETRACVRFMRCEPNAPGKQASGVVGLRAMQTI